MTGTSGSGGLSDLQREFLTAFAARSSVEEIVANKICALLGRAEKA